MSEKPQMDLNSDLLCQRTVMDLKELSSDRQWLLGLLEAYEVQTQKHMTSLIQALERQTEDPCLEFTHTLKSSSLQMGARHLGDGFHEIEKLVGAGDFLAAQKKCAWLKPILQDSLAGLREAFSAEVLP